VCSGFRKRSCSSKKLEWDDDSRKSYPALSMIPKSVQRFSEKIMLKQEARVG
jgi:hypothetical protein